MRVLLLSSAALVVITACSAAPPAQDQTPHADQPAGTAAKAAEPAAPANSSAAPEAKAAPSSAPATEEPPAEASPAPAPLTEEEQKETSTRCKPLMNAVQGAKGTGKSPLEALNDALKKPPASMKPADVARCSDLLDRGIRSYLIAAKQVEAKVMMKQISIRMAAAYADTGTLCPSSAPVPADRALVVRGPYTSTAADWASPGWKCLGFDVTGQPQRFQYEVRTDDAKKTFVIVARGTPGDDGRWVELRMNGKVNDRNEVETGSAKN
jgi:hypothetical protein